MKTGVVVVRCLSLLILSLLTGCATIFSGEPQSLTLNSDPSGARYQYGPYAGQTPDTIAAARDSLAHVAVFKLAGYEEKTVPVQTGIQGVTWVNILFWPGFIVDFATGNAYKVETPVINATLTREAAPSGR
jgi:hypothetical protein